MKLLANISINFGASISGSLFANKVAKSILYMPNFNRGSETQDLTLLTRNVDYMVNRFFHPFTTFIYATINALIYLYTIFILILSSYTSDFINFGKIIISLIISLIGIFVINKSYKIGKYLGEIYQGLLYNSTLIAKDLVSISKETRLYRNTKNLLIRHKKNERKLRLVEASKGSLPLVNSLTFEYIIGLILIILLATSKITAELAGIAFMVTKLLPVIQRINSSFLKVTNSIPLLNELIKRIDEFNNYLNLEEELNLSEQFKKAEKISTNKFIPSKISIKNYSITLKDKKISFPDCDFSKGDINLIIGKSGSGKTTFIESLLGVHKFNKIVSLNYEYLSTEISTKK